MGTPGILDGRLHFPAPCHADAKGLVAIGGDLSVERLRLAYRSGIFPWTANPISWWSPDPRGIFDLDDFHLPRSFEKFLRRQPFSVTINRAFRAVIEACATSNREGVWISPEFIEAYTRLHECGVAHSVECWLNDQLVGGIYGVSQGGLFAGESMFHRATNASKVALWHLVEQLRERGFALFDIQMVTPATRQFGAQEISRDEYLRRLSKAIQMGCTFFP